MNIFGQQAVGIAQRQRILITLARLLAAAQGRQRIPRRRAGGCNVPNVSDLPVVDRQSRHAPELAAIVRRRRQPARHRLAGDQDIVRSDRLSPRGQHGANLAGLAGILAVELDDFETQAVDQPNVARHTPTLEGAMEQVVCDDRRNRDLGGRVLAHAQGNRRCGSSSKAMTALASSR